MLRHLHVKNLALIDDLELSFESGLNVITGETGAGKSLLMQAIGLALGGRATADLIRRDTTESVVEAVFGLDTTRLTPLFAEHGLREAEDILVRRVITASGRSRVYLNDALTTVARLRQLSAGLLHVYGQHEQQVLREADSALSLLDDFAETTHRVQEMATRYQTLRQAWERLRALTEDKEAAEARQDFVRFQVDEIRRAALRPGEEEELRQERTILVHAERLYQTTSGGEAILTTSDGAVTDQLGRLVAQLRDLTRVDASLNEAVSLLSDGLAQVEEAALFLRRYGERLSPNPERLEEIDARLALLARLKKKYGGSIETILARQAGLEQELEHIEGGEEAIAALQQEVAQAADTAWVWADELSQERRGAARNLERSIQTELGQLGMQGAHFGVQFPQPEEDGASPSDSPFAHNGRRLGERGYDRVEFYLSANPGEPLLPLVQVASGGELSRLMLALKALSAAAEATPTLIFDEVDAGIGGGVAEVVGRRLKALADQHQVLCITHLPQIAAFADHAYTVTKTVTHGRTISSAKRLTQRERLQELARMLGGVEITPEARRHAREMLAGARRGEKTGSGSV